MALREVTLPTPRRDPRRDGDGDFLYVDVGAIDNQRQLIVAPKRIARADAPARARHEIRAGDVLFCLVRPYLRNIARVPQDLDGHVASSAFCVLRPSEEITSDFLFYSVVRDDFINSVVTYGESPPAARDEEFLELAIELPPLAEQLKIAESLDTGLTRISNGVDALRRVAVSLRLFRRALFDAAVDPRQAKAGHHLGSGGWHPARLDEIAAPGRDSFVDGPFGSNLKTSHYTDSGPRVVRLQNIGDGEFIDVAAHISNEHFRALGRHRADPDDVVIAALDDWPPRACLIPASLGPAIVKADCFRLRVDRTVADPRFVVYALNATGTKKQASRVAHGTGRRRLRLTDARRLLLALPSLEEQRQIVERTEAFESVRAAMAADVSASLRHAAALRQRVLAHEIQKPSAKGSPHG